MMEDTRKGYVHAGTCYGCAYMAQLGGAYCHDGQEANCPQVIEVDERRCAVCGQWIPPYKLETPDATVYPEDGYKLIDGKPVCGKCRRTSQEERNGWAWEYTRS